MFFENATSTRKIYDYENVNFNLLSTTNKKPQPAQGLLNSGNGRCTVLGNITLSFIN